MKGIAILLVSLTCILSAQASNYRFMKDSPIASFNDNDLQLMHDNAFKALDTVKDGDKLAWSNADTGNSGLANPIKSFIKNGMSCRTLRLINKSNQNVAESIFNFCKTSNNSWKILN